MNRDFKGVWIPKEIWLSTELSAVEKFILTEIDSLDNEDHCYASNDHFAEFCQCSIPTVTRTIKHLKDMGFIEVSNFDGRTRVIKMIRQTNQNDEADSSKRLTSNTISKTKNKTKNNSKELLGNSDSKTSFLGSVSETKVEKPKKKNLYEKCLDLIFEYTDDINLQGLLVTYLNYRLEIKDKPLYANMWKGMLKKLESIDENDCGVACAIVQQSINRGYLGFFPVNTYNRSTSLHDKLNESGATNVPHITKEEEAELERRVMLGELQEY